MHRKSLIQNMKRVLCMDIYKGICNSVREQYLQQILTVKPKLIMWKKRQRGISDPGDNFSNGIELRNSMK